MELHEHVELGQGQAFGHAPPHLPQHEAVGLEQAHPHGDGERVVARSRPSRYHRTATASISTLAPSSSRDFTSTRLIAG